jgi:hypothetical protein
MKCDKCIWLVKINEIQALCPYLRCVLEKGWEIDEGVNENGICRSINNYICGE